MKWYIAIFGSTNYYTCVDGYELVKAESLVEAESKAIKTRWKEQYSKNPYYQDGSLPEYISIQNIFECGSVKPKVY